MTVFEHVIESAIITSLHGSLTPVAVRYLVAKGSGRFRLLIAGYSLIASYG
jgi:hypothetical protein